MNVSSTRCLVLKTADHGESDKIVTLFSENLGKVTGIAKGAKRSKKRFVNKLEPFSRILVSYKPSRTSTLLFIAEAELEHAFLSLRQSYQKYAGAMYLCELILRFTKEKDPECGLFSLLTWALHALDQGDRPLKIAALFHIRLLDIAGYRPELECCSQCCKPISPKNTYTMQPGIGALLCNQCRSGNTMLTRQLSVQTLKFLEKAQGVSLGHLSRLQLPDKAARETLYTLHGYSCSLLQQDIHSWKNLMATLK
ncbi:DNA repair protein RecO [Desulfogranum marinum]|jgi:DNA repair protein RecO (recombination protein O)|uniref:DNA repair protein RecO n=1 Tax=Desulfogranum marinum TaxID=453220 RepID=UPI0029C7CDF8|nr:DNA repair protein RecO [Desulfogranum marinum]